MARNNSRQTTGSSKRDFLAKERIVLREIKETRLRLRVVQATNLVTLDGALIEESNQLVKIVSAMGFGI